MDFSRFNKKSFTIISILPLLFIKVYRRNVSLVFYCFTMNFCSVYARIGKPVFLVFLMRFSVSPVCTQPVKIRKGDKNNG